MEDKSVVSAASNWVDEVVSKLDAASGGILEVKIGDETISAFISDEVVLFFKNNKTVLTNLGKDLFKSFLILISEKKQEEAFNIVLQAMDAQAIIDEMNINAHELQQANDHRDAFYAALKKWAITTLEAAATKLLIGLLL